ncbi:hypothetical protein F1559_005182 [Cyanidiococcus yangmingshanensis]|uniref:Uncharacterized protein n=1 Tax=Cyanidiococcus yangmingshanensis TaxID=2690220 RepID=A0A7J7IPS2_9RHOD|nr:hypothetical protein F1559_005182 [Cyanidiococcus yangmingshanensis]
MFAYQHIHTYVPVCRSRSASTLRDQNPSWSVKQTPVSSPGPARDSARENAALLQTRRALKEPRDRAAPGRAAPVAPHERRPLRETLPPYRGRTPSTMSKSTVWQSPDHNWVLDDCRI